MNDTPPEAQPDAGTSPTPVSDVDAGTFKMLSPETRQAMDSIAQRERFDAGRIIFDEGDHCNDLFIVEDGEVVCYRTGQAEDEEWPILRVARGDIFGELTFLDGGPQHLTARAETDSAILKVSPFDLLELDDGDHYYDNLRASVGITVVERLRTGTEIHVAVLKRQLDLARMQQHFGRFFLYTLALFSIVMLVSNAIATRLLNVDIYTQSFAWQYLAILLLPTLVIIRMLRLSLHDMGLSSVGLRKSLTEGGALSLVAIGLTAAFIAFSGKPVVVHWAGFPTYIAHSFLQEVVARGFMQTSFQRFLNDQKGLRSVFISSVLFGMFHVHFGLPAVGVVILSGFVFGAFYLRHQNIYGVTLLHIVLGSCAFTLGLL
ncbi:CAAX protease self-immunity [Tistlia consotensis]|uniref:CAAX protease self-immunity n=1 Tax=Tistlia consotensis USBA 355 TaxID=560819 RepID=A0A1Y6BHW9_9PROT|nr:cyclic nucleotide-binding domain-containing protein [Tistlia consotensis]SMF05039.1 CAAX protease self-immunity [Tistlia consotensis USBA 355]SNR54989.1 CAAX protease self-immunity [Tistlia consotensis]